MAISAWSIRTHQTARVLRPREFPAALEYCRLAGTQGVLAGARIADLMAARLSTGEIWAMAQEVRWPGQIRHSDIKALCWRGVNLMPVGLTAESVAAFAHLAATRGGRPASIVGPANAVLALWEELEPVWGAARQILAEQWLMELSDPPLVRPDPAVRQATADQLNWIVPAAAAMFTEELGFAPHDQGGAYRRHVAGLVERGSVYVRGEPGLGTVEFKADLGAILADRTQIQGVWTRPDLRGRGIAKAGVAAVVQAAGRRGLRSVSLYVNSHNLPAVAAYRAVGFSRVGVFATVMF